jgi:hypothetical protein
MKGWGYLGIAVGWLCLAIPASATGTFAIKAQEPGEHWDVTAVPLAPAPLEETPSKPLWRPQPEPSLFSYPTQVKFIAYPSAIVLLNTWTRLALEKRLLQLASPLDALFCPEPPAIELTLARLR